jgi:hypothetical protein
MAIDRAKINISIQMPTIIRSRRFFGSNNNFIAKTPAKVPDPHKYFQ